MAERTGLWLDDQDTIPVPTGRSFLLDTNVLLHDADSLHAFEDNNVILTIDVLEELDRFKRGNDEKARNARRVIRDHRRPARRAAPSARAWPSPAAASSTSSSRASPTSCPRAWTAPSPTTASWPWRWP